MAVMEMVGVLLLSKPAASRGKHARVMFAVPSSILFSLSSSNALIAQ
jgi:hypothetical protein